MRTDSMATRVARLTDEQRKLLAERLSGVKAGASAIAPNPARADAPLGCAQESFWLLNQLEAAGPAYNCRTANRLRGPLDRDALQRSLDLVVERHEALRASFDWTD